MSVIAGSFDSFARNVDVSRKLNEQWSLFFSSSQDNSDNYRYHNALETGALFSRLNYKKDSTE
ncbi:hypothetical protein, partial [Vibrio echinoideorum]